MAVWENEEGVFFKIKVQPKSSKNEIKGLHGDLLRIRLTAPPIDGAANEACREFFSKLSRVPKTRIEIVAGLTARNKTVLIKGMQKTEFCALIKEYL